MTMELLNGKIIQKPLTSHKFSSKFIFSFYQKFTWKFEVKIIPGIIYQIDVWWLKQFQLNTFRIPSVPIIDAVAYINNILKIVNVRRCESMIYIYIRVYIYYTSSKTLSEIQYYICFESKLISVRNLNLFKNTKRSTFYPWCTNMF